MPAAPLRHRQRRSAGTSSLAAVALTSLTAGMGLAGCGGGNSSTPCTDPPYYTVLPIPQANIASAGPLGGMNPPSHTIPSDHAGLYVTGTGVPIVVPGDMHVDSVRRTRYLVSATRQGLTDYAIYYHICQHVTGQLGHLQTLRNDLASQIKPSDCSTYSTADETVEACVTPVSVSLKAGEALGTVGGPTAGAFDFGTYDDRHTNFFVNPSRFNGLTLHAVCPYELFPPALAEVMLSKVGYGGDYRTVPPRCGTMEVDVAGTAQGVWVDQTYTGALTGDETPLLTLALDSIHPDTTEVLSMGSPALGATIVYVPIQTSGQVDRLFSDIVPDGTMYCYFAGATATRSYFVSLGTDDVLTIEAVDHAAGASPCNGAPNTWAFDGSALRYVR